MNTPKNPHFHTPNIYLCLFSVLLVSCASAIECIPAERTALLGLKHVFYDLEGFYSSWTPSSNCCNWTGVTCHPQSRHVTEISLSKISVGGELPSDLFTSLKNLTHFDLDLESYLGIITGVFPEFPENSCLQTFKINGASMFCGIPDSIGNLQHLTDLQIRGAGLTGSLPSSIGSLTKLITLDVSANRLTGEIPSSIGNLVNLTRMDFSSNYLSGQIPMSLFSFPSLEYVDLSYNHLSGQIEELLNPSTTLRSIDLEYNQTRGQIPNSLPKLPALRTLYLTSNNFSGTLDLDLVATLGKLAAIDISNNKIWVQESSNNDYIHSFPMLNWLGFASCNLTKVPRFLKLQNNMSYVDLSNNNISGNIPKWIWTPNMKKINLSNNKFMHMETPVDLTYSSTFYSYIDLSFNVLQGPVPLPPSHINNYLDYSNNNFSYAIPANFSLYLNFTEFLSLANNRLIGEIPQSIGQSTHLLTVLDLSNNYLTGPIPPNIFNCPSLVLLKLNGNNLEGAIPSRIEEECGLTAILVGENHLNGMLPKSLLNCSELEVLDLANNHLSGPYPLWLGNFANLSVLILKGNGFYGPIEFNENIDSNNQFSKIQILDISSNSITGNLPSKLFSNLKAIMNVSTVVPGGGDYVTSVYRENLDVDEVDFDYSHILTVTSKGYSYTLGRILKIDYTYVDFSNNYFEGDIPNVISKLEGLHILNLSHNALTGKIPSSLGKMVQLESLDLSENQLFGSIPPELASLTFLRILNLSKNSLSGNIPQKGQLTTFTHNSFDGNPNLCGSPLSKLCVNTSPSAINPVSSDPDSSSTYVIGMALSVGLGYGFGFAMVILYQTVPWKHWMKKIANMQL